MLTFLAPMALFGLATLAIPLLIHLFKPKRTRVVPFSSLRWLRESQQRLSKRVQWHQLLLFLLRAGMLALLVLAIAKPLLVRRGGGGGTQRIVIIDTGRAMGYEGARGVTAMAQARKLATGLLRRGRVGDLYSVCVVGEKVRALGPLVPDPSHFLEEVARLSSEGSERAVSEALRLVPMLQRGQPRPELIELYFVTANLDASWRQSDINDLMAALTVPVRVTVISTATSDPRNAWIATADRLQGSRAGVQMLRVQVQANDAEIVKRSVRLTGVTGLAPLEREVALEAGRPSWTTFELPLPEDDELRTGVVTLTPSDALSDDDSYWVDLAPRGRQTLLVIEPDVTQIRELQPGFHLRTALETLGEAAQGGFRVVVRTPEALRESEVAEADAVIWVDPQPVAAGVVERLQEQVAAGVGLALFLGQGSDSDFCNSVLAQPTAGDVALLPRRIAGVVATGRGEALVQWQGVAWQHPWLAPFADPVYGDLARAGFKAYLRLDGAAREGERLLAHYPDQTPALLEHDFGAGRVVVINSSASDQWSDFPRRRGYLPWVDGLLEHLGSRIEGAQLEVGDAAYRMVGDLQEGSSVELLAPDGTAVAVTVERRAGRHAIQSAPLQQAGIYRLCYTANSGKEVELPLPVQVGRKFSRLMPMESEMLEAWWAPAAVTLAVAESGGSGAAVGQALRSNLELLLLLSALLLFLIETLLAAWLTPRANPRIINSSIVARRGFFKESSEAEGEA